MMVSLDSPPSSGFLTGKSRDLRWIRAPSLLPNQSKNLEFCDFQRVSAAENKENLKGQAKRIQDYCATKGDLVAFVVEEIGSCVNDVRPKLLMQLIVVNHKDRLTRFGFNRIELLLKMQNRKIEVINLAENSNNRYKISSAV